MKINYFSITSATTLNFDFTSAASICVLRGHYSDLVLNLLREMIGDYGAQSDPDRVDDGRFIIHAGIEMDGKKYKVCYIRNADYFDDNRMAANFEPDSFKFSEDDTREFVDKCNERDIDHSNVLHNTADALSCDDDRPVFIYDFFDRLDEAIDITPILDKLSSLGRQVFISVCSNYPTEKILHDKVQIIEMEVGNVAN